MKFSTVNRISKGDEGRFPGKLQLDDPVSMRYKRMEFLSIRIRSIPSGRGSEKVPLRLLQKNKRQESGLRNIPRFCSLDGFTELSSALGGVALRTLEPFDTVCARTLNNDYYIFLIEPESGKALVQGGRYFSQPIEATVSGSTFGGCMLKMGWLGIGLHIEICASGQRIVTSPVQSLHIEYAGN